MHPLVTIVRGIGSRDSKSIGKHYNYLQIHTIMIVGLNIVMRYDKIQKIKIRIVTGPPGMLIRGVIFIKIDVKVKYSTKPGQYKLRECPDHTYLMKSLLFFPLTSFLSWILSRRNRPRYILFYVNNNTIMTWKVAWP